MYDRINADSVEITLDHSGKLSVVVDGECLVRIANCVNIWIQQPGEELNGEESITVGTHHYVSEYTQVKTDTTRTDEIKSGDE